MNAIQRTFKQMDNIIRIGIVEDQLLFLEGLKAMLEPMEEFDIVFQSMDGFSVLDKLKQSTILPDLLLLDSSLPPNGQEQFDGKMVVDVVMQHYPDMKILMLSANNDDDLIAELIEAGAHGYLNKNSEPEEVYEAIYSVYRNGSYINQQTLQAIQKRMNEKGQKKPKPLDEPLTQREIEVLELVCQQMKTEEIAEQLFISVKTVNGHRNNLLQKTGSRNVAGLVLYAVKKNLVEIS